MTGRRFELALRAGGHVELARLAEGLREEAQKHRPWDRGSLAAENAETMRRRYKAGGHIPQVFPVMPLSLAPQSPPEPPKREVLAVEAGLFTVAGWLLSTFDRVLAEAVAREFDRIDPLPPVEGP